MLCVYPSMPKIAYKTPFPASAPSKYFTPLTLLSYVVGKQLQN